MNVKPINDLSQVLLKFQPLETDTRFRKGVKETILSCVDNYLNTNNDYEKKYNLSVIYQYLQLLRND